MEEPNSDKLEIVLEVKDSALLSNIIEFRIKLLVLFSIYDVVDIALEQSFQKERKRCEEEVVERDVEIIIVGLGTETAEESEIELG